MAPTAYESITKSEQFNYVKFKATVKELNESGLMSSNINMMGKKEIAIKNFMDAIEKIPEENIGKMPDSVVDMNNTFCDILEASDNSGGGKRKADSEEKEETKKGKQVGNIVLMKQLLDDKKSDEEILNAFIERYGAKGITDTKFIEKRVATYKSLAKK